MAKFRNTRSGDVITVHGPVTDLYARKAHWVRLPDAVPVQPPDEQPDPDTTTDDGQEPPVEEQPPAQEPAAEKSTKSTRRRG